MSSTSQGGPHSLGDASRLCQPSFQVDSIPLLLDPADLLVGEDIFDSHVTSADSSDPNYSTRLLLHHPSDSIDVSGLLVLPQSFEAIYLGETFCSYISINNSSNFEVGDIIIKAEMQTEWQRLVLLETSKSPVESIRAGGRYDFIVEQVETSSRTELRR